MRANSGFYSHAVVAVCRKMDVRFSITIRQSPATRRLIEAIHRGGLDADPVLARRRR